MQGQYSSFILIQSRRLAPWIDWGAAQARSSDRERQDANFGRAAAGAQGGGCRNGYLQAPVSASKLDPHDACAGGAPGSLAFERAVMGMPLANFSKFVALALTPRRVSYEVVQESLGPRFASGSQFIPLRGKRSHRQSA